MSSQVWFSADQHFNHTKCIELMNRPFSSIEEMNEALIENHNKVVKPGDRVYHVGDFAWHDHNKFVTRMTGQHYLIKGNHDHVGRTKEPLKFIWIKDVERLKLGEHLVWLSHYAHRVWPQSHYGAFHFYGHSHGMMPSFGRSCDVGVDAWGYRPVSFDELYELLKDEGCMLHHPTEEL